MLQKLNHPQTAIRVSAERAMNAKLQGGCQVPIGSFAHFNQPDSNAHGELSMTALVASPDGTTVLKTSGKVQCAIDDIGAAKKIGATLADALLAKGAKAILDAL